MKKLTCLLALLSIAFVSCTNEDGTGSGSALPGVWEFPNGVEILIINPDGTIASMVRASSFYWKESKDNRRSYLCFDSQTNGTWVLDDSGKILMVSMPAYSGTAVILSLTSRQLILSGGSFGNGVVLKRLNYLPYKAPDSITGLCVDKDHYFTDFVECKSIPTQIGNVSYSYTKTGKSTAVITMDYTDSSGNRCSSTKNLEFFNDEIVRANGTWSWWGKSETSFSSLTTDDAEWNGEKVHFTGRYSASDEPVFDWVSVFVSELDNVSCWNGKMFITEMNADGSFSIDAAGLDQSKTYWYRTFVQASSAAYYGPVKVLRPGAITGDVDADDYFSFSVENQGAVIDAYDDETYIVNVDVETLRTDGVSQFGIHNSNNGKTFLFPVGESRVQYSLPGLPFSGDLYAAVEKDGVVYRGTMPYHLNIAAYPAWIDSEFAPVYVVYYSDPEYNYYQFRYYVSFNVERGIDHIDDICFKNSGDTSHYTMYRLGSKTSYSAYFSRYSENEPRLQLHPMTWTSVDSEYLMYFSCGCAPAIYGSTTSYDDYFARSLNNNDGGFTASDATVWKHHASGDYEGCWVATNNDGGSSRKVSARLISEQLFIKGDNASLSAYLGKGDVSTLSYCMSVEVSTDGGSTWNKVSSDIDSSAWLNADISAYCGKNIRFAFLYESDSSVCENIAIDRVFVENVVTKTKTQDIHAYSSVPRQDPYREAGTNNDSSERDLNENARHIR